MDERIVGRKPRKLSFAEAAALPLLATAAIGLALCSRVLADDHKKKHHHHQETDKDKKEEVVKLVAVVGQSAVTVKNGNASSAP